MRHVNSKDFNTHLGDYLDVAAGEPVTVTRPGRTAAVVVSAAEYDRLRELDELSRAAGVADAPTGRIAHWARIGRLVEDNPDLSYGLVRLALRSKREADAGRLEDYWPASPVRVLVTPSFRDLSECLTPEQRSDLESAVQRLTVYPTAGVPKAGGLGWMRVTRCVLAGDCFRLAYEYRPAEAVVLHAAECPNPFLADVDHLIERSGAARPALGRSAGRDEPDVDRNTRPRKAGG